MQGNNGQFQAGTHWRKPKPHWESEWLRQQYVVLGKSAGDIAKECECTDANIIFWLRKHGIKRRSIAEARSLKYWGSSGEANPMHGKTGAANPRYVDGRSPERQSLYARSEGKEFLRRIRERDGFRCCRCGEYSKTPRALHVHHIKPWKSDEALRFEDSNAITLCCACHGWVHSKKNTGKDFLR